MTETAEKQVYEVRAEILKAMAHPARLQMIDAMSDTEMCVCDLAELVDLAVPTVSRHLKKMKTAGILTTRRDGNHIYHTLRCPCVTNVFQCIDDVLLSDDERARDVCDLIRQSSQHTER